MKNEPYVGNPYWCEECEEVPHRDWCVRGQAIYMEMRRKRKACSHSNPHPDSNICDDCGGAIRVLPCNPQEKN